MSVGVLRHELLVQDALDVLLLPGIMMDIGEQVLSLVVACGLAQFTCCVGATLAVLLLVVQQVAAQQVAGCVPIVSNCDRWKGCL